MRALSRVGRDAVQTASVRSITSTHFPLIQPPHPRLPLPPPLCHSYVSLLEDEGLHPQVACSWPSWQSGLRAGAPHRDERDTSVVIDHTFESGALLI